MNEWEKTAKEAEREWPERWANLGVIRVTKEKKDRVSGETVWSTASNYGERTQKIEEPRPQNLGLWCL